MRKKNSIYNRCITQMHFILYFRSAALVAAIKPSSFYLIYVSSCYLKNFHPIWEIFWKWDIITCLWQYWTIVILISNSNQNYCISCFENLVLLSCLENRVYSCKFHALITTSLTQGHANCIFIINYFFLYFDFWMAGWSLDIIEKHY